MKHSVISYPHPSALALKPSSLAIHTSISYTSTPLPHSTASLALNLSHSRFSLLRPRRVIARTSLPIIVVRAPIRVRVVVAAICVRIVVGIAVRSSRAVVAGTVVISLHIVSVMLGSRGAWIVQGRSGGR